MVPSITILKNLVCDKGIWSKTYIARLGCIYLALVFVSVVKVFKVPCHLASQRNCQGFGLDIWIGLGTSSGLIFHLWRRRAHILWLSLRSEDISSVNFWLL